MPYDDEYLTPRAEETRPGEDDYETEIEARGARAHKIEAQAMENGLKASVGPDTVYVTGPYDVLWTFLVATGEMDPGAAHKAMSPVMRSEGAGMNEDELNPVFDDDVEMRDEKHADPSGREWSSGLDELELTGEAEDAVAAEQATTNESAEHFDKFMDSIVIKEEATKKVDAEDTPQRVYNKRYREKALNRMRIGRTQ